MSERLIRLRLSAWMVQLLSSVLEKLPDQLGKKLVLPEKLLPADDADLHEAWRQSLLEQLDADFSFLRKTLVRLRSNGVADLNTASAEVFLRSVTAVRLSLQEGFLASLPAGDLQTDGINIETLPEQTQPAYACYLLLADIQGQVIAQIEQYENAPSAPLSEYPEGFFHSPPANGTQPQPPAENDTFADTEGTEGGENNPPADAADTARPKDADDTGTNPPQPPEDKPAPGE